MVRVQDLLAWLELGWILLRFLCTHHDLAFSASLIIARFDTLAIDLWPQTRISRNKSLAAERSVVRSDTVKPLRTGAVGPCASKTMGEPLPMSGANLGAANKLALLETKCPQYEEAPYWAMLTRQQTEGGCLPRVHRGYRGQKEARYVVQG